MKVFVVLSVVIALAAARPGVIAPFAYHHAPLAYTAQVAYAAPVAYTASVPAVPVEVSSQYHAQDSLGQYNYGYTGGLSSKAESRSADGVTRGAYSYVDAEGKIQNVQYTADAVNGFQVSATNLPVAPVAKSIDLVAPVPVEDTPEVAKAKADHLAAVEEAKARAAEAPKEVEVVAPVEPVAPVAPVAPVVSYTAPVTTYTAPVATYAYSTPAVASYTHHQYLPFVPYNPSFSYDFAAVAPAPAYTYPFGHVPFVGTPVAPVAAPPAETPVANADATVTDDDTVEVKAKEE